MITNDEIIMYFEEEKKKDQRIPLSLVLDSPAITIDDNAYK
jgi:hypothetical protein